MTKDKNFNASNKIEVKNTSLDLSTPKIMGIINMTEDSFYDGGTNYNSNKTLKKITKFIKEGADIIDIGGYSSRPGAKNISIKEEWKRIKDIIPIVNKNFPKTIISVDTFRSEIAKRAIENGAHIINDISGGSIDKSLFDTVANLKTPYILTHIKGNPENMQENPNYNSVINEITEYFQKKIKTLKSKGINNIIIDPGFGFGKSLQHNYEILNNLNKFKKFNLPILVGVSRKSMIYRLLETNPKEALNGTTIVNTLCLLGGANILRVHDVKEAKECIKIIKFAQNIN
ncbi:MAG: dihydropteroate synthase [Flavobacteriales bacterium]|nr:dihydropteroate synthase [Flavobacteriales bacterium]